MIRLLVVDNSALMRRLLGALFRAEGDFELEFARDGGEALARLAAFRPDVLTLDVQMPGMDGLACLDRIMLERPCPVVMLSSVTEAGAEVTLEALALGAVDFVAKPGGAISLRMDEFGPLLVRKVRAAAGARVRRSARLAERVRLHMREAVPRLERDRGRMPLRASDPAARGRGAVPPAVRPGCRRRPAGRSRNRSWACPNRWRCRNVSCWWALRPAGRRRWMRCLARSRRISRGRSWSRSTCRQVSPGRWRAGSTGFASDAWSKRRSRCRCVPATPISAGVTPTSCWRSATGRSMAVAAPALPDTPLASQRGPAGDQRHGAVPAIAARGRADDRHGQ